MRLSPTLSNLTLFLLMSAHAGAQQDAERGQLSGVVVDAVTKRPMEFARVALYSSSDSALVTGAVTDAQGTFLIERVPDGMYYVDAVFLGYDPHRVARVQIDDRTHRIDLGTIPLTPGSVQSKEVIISGERPSLQYRIDRKVLDAREWSTTASGTAVDILEQIPSVSVDIEGNVSLRGSGSFAVLIDGKPSVLDAQDALQQISASSISSIEVITNPSAKFDPEGTAGVINIITVQRKQSGMTGVLSANAGANETYGGDAMFNYRTGPMESAVSFDHNTRSFPGSNTTTTRYSGLDSANGLISSGAYSNGRIRSGMRGSMKLDAWEGGNIGLRARYGEREQSNNSARLFETLTGADVIRSQSNTTNRHREGTSFDVALEFEHQLGRRDHRFIGDISYGSDDNDELTISEVIESGGIVEGRRTTEAGPSQEIEMRLDYENQLSEEGKLEAGYQGEIDWDEERTGLSEYDPTQSMYAVLPQFARLSDCNEQEHALYAVYGNAVGSFGYQVGFRGENTTRVITQRSLGNEFRLNEWDYFPTVHASYQFDDGQQIMASYARRIDRPGGWELEPFMTWVDATTVRAGNPSLRPEYIDSYEAGAQSFMFGIPLNAEVYYRVTHNRIEDVRSVYASNVTLETSANVGSDNALGMEMMATIDPWKWWDLQLIGNAYRYEIDATILGQSLRRSNLQWRTRANSMFKVTGSTRIQFNVHVRSSSVGAQEQEKGFVSADLGIRQSLFRNRLTLTLQIRDLFGSVRREETTTAADFVRQEVRYRDAPLFFLNLRLNLGSNDEDEEEGEEEERRFDVED